MKKITAIAIAAAAVFVLAACDTETPDSTTDSIATETEAPVTEAPVVTEVEAPQPVATEASAPVVTEAPATGRVMFDATGMDLQFAQDTVQADLGIWFSDSEDASGRDRMQLVDRNWTVVGQDPAPGTPVNDDTEIIFYVDK